MQTLLVPSDLSQNSTTALKYAISLNESVKARLILFHCSRMPAGKLINAADDGERKIILDADNVENTKLLQDQISASGAGVRAAEIIIESEPMIVESIIEVSEKNKVDLIIMGTHGVTGVKKFFFGSNTAELITKSNIPVLAIPENYAFVPVHNIIFSTDLVNFKNEISKILPVAGATGATLKVLYLDYGSHITGNLLNEAQEIINKLTYNKVELVVRPATIEYTLIRQINETVQTLDPAWVVMFTRERSFWDKIFAKSKTEELSLSLRYPLLSYRKD